MPLQLLLPDFADGASRINCGLHILKKGGIVTYFIGGDNFFHHAVEDTSSRRYILASLVDNGHVRPLDSVDLWITGLRRDQSKTRGAIPKAAILNHGERKIIKLAPLIDWSEQQVWDYIRTNDVPYNTLYDKGYTSIGCYICSTPTRPGEDKRAGRWRWTNQLNDEHHKECGLHLNGSGI